MGVGKQKKVIKTHQVQNNNLYMHEWFQIYIVHVKTIMYRYMYMCTLLHFKSYVYMFTVPSQLVKGHYIGIHVEDVVGVRRVLL